MNRLLVTITVLALLAAAATAVSVVLAPSPSPLDGRGILGFLILTTWAGSVVLIRRAHSQSAPRD